jgi:putative NADH-flavin reductase
MRIFVVGANGRTGREIVAGALADHHQVTAFVRQTRGLPQSSIPGLRVVTGSVLTEQDRLSTALVGHDIVISALGNGLSLRGGRAPKILAAATEQLVGGMQRAGVRRVVTMLSYGSGATRRHAPWYIRALATTVLRTDFADLAVADAALRRSDLDWTVAYFGALTDQRSTGAAIAASLTRPRHYRIPRIDVASALLRLATDDARIRTRVVLDGAAAGGAGRELVPPTRRRPIASTQ